MITVLDAYTYFIDFDDELPCSCDWYLIRKPVSYNLLVINSFAGIGFYRVRIGGNNPDALVSDSISKSFVTRRRAADSAVARQGEVDKVTDGLEME